MSFQDEELIRRERQKYLKKREQYEARREALKLTFAKTLSDPSLKKAISRDLASAIQQTEMGQIDPILRSVMGSESKWSGK